MYGSNDLSDTSDATVNKVHDSQKLSPGKTAAAKIGFKVHVHSSVDNFILITQNSVSIVYNFAYTMHMYMYMHIL